MMRSLSSGVAGLRTHQTRMDVIGNNIANVNTYGFKASRTTFADVYYQNLGGASSGTSGVEGGKNPTQIGYGSAVATIDVANSVSSAGSTDYALDVFISGDGFIVSKDVNGKTMYTRLGKLDFDSAGNLVDGNGNLVQGFPMKEDGKPNISPDGTIQSSDLRTIVGDPEILSKLTSISISSTGLIVGTLEGDKIIKVGTTPDFIDNDTVSINKDSHFLGDVKLSIGALPSSADINGAVPNWFSTASPAYNPTVSNVQFGDVGLPAADGVNVTYDFSIHGKTFELKVTDLNDSTNDGVYEGVVQEDGSVVLKNKTTSKIAMSFTVSSLPNGATTSTPVPVSDQFKNIKYQISTRDKGDNIVKLPMNNNGEPSNVIDMTAPGKVALTDLGGIEVTIDTSDPSFKSTVLTLGTATPDDDVLYSIGNLAIAKFPNPNGMMEAGSSYFLETANSGTPVFVRPGIDGTGTLMGSNLEMSNVDISKEFTDMITTQRGFQANSRIITVSDTMLEELVNLKR